jgi:hypothetical protein
MWYQTKVVVNGLVVWPIKNFIFSNARMLSSDARAKTASARCPEGSLFYIGCSLLYRSAYNVATNVDSRKRIINSNSLLLFRPLYHTIQRPGHTPAGVSISHVFMSTGLWDRCVPEWYGGAYQRIVPPPPHPLSQRV